MVLGLMLASQWPAAAVPTLGDPPNAPADLAGLPGGGARPRIVTGGLSVDTTSREQVREFYNSIYTASSDVAMNTTAETDSCVPGTNSPLYVDATLLRINWFRALAGLPASISFDPTECTEDQAAAVMMSEHGALQHSGSWTGWDCFSTDATNAADHSNLALGYSGPDAITAYILDNEGNYVVGHRRWMLYPQTETMGTGDVPAEDTTYAANATWVIDANYGGARPATRTPYVAWPPTGYVPYQVAFPQWSFALSNADLSAATVTMTSNGVAMAITQQAYATGYGENSVVWYLTSQDVIDETAFPFNGKDTVYSVTVSNVVTTGGAESFTYNVTLFDPAVPGTNYTPLVVSGPSQTAINTSNQFTCATASNPETTGYQWIVSAVTNGNFTDTAQHELTNFNISPTPSYPVITNPPAGSGECFHLCHVDPVPQYLQLNRILYVSNSTALSFKSLLGYASSDETARVQISIDGGGTWTDLFAETGTNGAGESAFTQHAISLSAYAGKSAQVRFNFDYSSGEYYPENSPYVGWCLENIGVTNCQQLLNPSTNATMATNFWFLSAKAGNYLIQVRGVIFTGFPTDFGVSKLVTAVPGPAIITLAAPSVSGNQIKIGFTLSGSATNFSLLQANLLAGPWVTNHGAALTTNVAGSSYQFATTNGPAMRFYRVVTP
jgi:hypothetical protein